MAENKILYASMSHMTANDSSLLRDMHPQQPDGYPLLVLDTGEGWIVSTWHDLADTMWNGRTVCQALERYGHSFGFISIVRHAIQSGCRWCEFDVDSDALEGFELYEWE